jgi:Na+-driven multidrug efflux pump
VGVSVGIGVSVGVGVGTFLTAETGENEQARAKKTTTQKVTIIFFMGIYDLLCIILYFSLKR